MFESKTDEFFAAADGDSIARLLQEKVDDWIRVFQMTSNYKRIRKSWAFYYGNTSLGGATSSGITSAGPVGEYSLMVNNHFRNLIQHLHVLTTSQRPALECQAANSDSESQEQCQLGDALLDYYMRDKKVERYLKVACEHALALGEGFVGVEWESTQGNIYASTESGQPIYEGDISLTNYTPLDVVRDPWRNDSSLPWTITIKWKNRWNLIAKYPELAAQIKSINPDELWRFRDDFFNRIWWMQNDLIPEFTFQHERCEALPQGRLVKFLSKDAKLLDAPLPTEKVSIYRITPADQFDTIFGYSAAFDLLGPQEALNIVDSSTITSIKTFGVGCVKLPEGHNVQYEQIADGLSALTVNEKNGKIEAMNFLNIPQAMPNFRAQIMGDMEKLSAVNSVVRGDPQQNITSGSFAALVAAQAVQFNSGLQMGYSQINEDIGGCIIEMLQKFANSERVAKIVGKNSRYMLKSFSSQDLQSIKGVLVQQANPLTKTNAGRMNMADVFLQKGLIKEPEQYQQVLETGRLDPILENQRTRLNNIKRENEMLRDGKEEPVAVLTEDHKLHIEEHSAVLDNPESKLVDGVRQLTLAHINEHMNLWSQATQMGLSQALGLQPFTPPMPPPGMMPPGAAPVPQGPPQGGRMGPSTGPHPKPHQVKGGKIIPPGQQLQTAPGANLPKGPLPPMVAGSNERANINP